MLLIALKAASAIVATLVLLVLTRLIRRAFRLPRPIRMSERRRTELAELSKRLDRQTVIPVLFLLFVSVAFVTVVLDQLCQLWIGFGTGTHYLLDPVTPRATWLKWAIPTGLVLGFALGGFLGNVYILAVYGWWTRAMYFVGGKIKFRMHYIRAFWSIWLVVAVLNAPLVILQFDWYYRVDESGMTVNDLWGLGERHYRNDEIRQLVRTTHLTTKLGDVVQRPRYIIRFTDGNECIFDSAFEEYDPAIQLLSKKSGKPIQRVMFIEQAVEK